MAGVLAGPAGAAEADAQFEELRRELEALRQKLQALEAVKARVEELERRLSRKEAERVTPVRDEPAVDEAPAERPFHVGGALRFNYFWKDYDTDSEAKRGDLGLDLFRVNVDGESDGVQVSAEYRFYPYMDALHHGWIGFRPSASDRVQVGVSKVPFGLLPYAAHSYWFGMPYYLGLADDYDAGVKYRRNDGPWQTQVAFFKNDELGDGSDLDRISYDAAAVGTARNEETNSVAARLAYTVNPGGECSHELGLSGQGGELYNLDTERTGDRWAAALHLDSRCGRWNGQLELGRYRYNPEHPAGVGDRTVTLGGFAASHAVAAEGTFAVANLAYNVPVEGPRLKLLTCYNDFSVLDKEPERFDNSYLNTTGCVAQIGPTYTYLDLIHGRNALYLGEGSLAGGGSDDWERRLNINIGYYW